MSLPAPNIGLQRTSACGLAAEAGSFGGAIHGVPIAMLVSVGFLMSCSTLRIQAPGTLLVRAEVSSTSGVEEVVTISMDGIFHEHSRANLSAGSHESERRLTSLEIASIADAARDAKFQELTSESLWPHTVVMDEAILILTFRGDVGNHTVKAEGVEREKNNPQVARFLHVWNAVMSLSERGHE